MKFKHNETAETAVGTKVFVYFNLHQKCFSVKALTGANKGRVIAHSDTITLKGVVFKVSEAGRQRVLIEKKKNVHAGVVGYLEAFEYNTLSDYRTAYYNPYTTPKFQCSEGDLYKADYAILDHKNIYFK